VDPAVGIELLARPGDAVTAGQPLARLHHAGRGVDEATQLLLGAYQIGAEAAPAHPLVLEVLR
jgi:pyrimidine-nucleoside phosphorylase/thymidine phosphorylase